MNACEARGGYGGGGGRLSASGPLRKAGGVVLSASRPMRKAGGERGLLYASLRSDTKSTGGGAACHTMIYIFRDSAWGVERGAANGPRGCISYEGRGGAADPPPPQAYAGSGAEWQSSDIKKENSSALYLSHKTVYFVPIVRTQSHLKFLLRRLLILHLLILLPSG